MVINALSQVINAPRPFSSATDHASTSGPKFQHRVRAISTDRAESSSARVHASNLRDFRGDSEKSCSECADYGAIRSRSHCADGGPLERRETKRRDD
ncbi:hypothetical protein PVK06_021036 [Gossypium arboreum]|uniref:Uncharacterized protein n=1 Tax=Gossypium arboreum TaxID=29729 RepID=A0ABR0PNW6_GOSAR|nr:hypothetical protein PVK06_021036 [Gossypium arboreum]